MPPTFIVSHPASIRPYERALVSLHLSGMLLFFSLPLSEPGPPATTSSTRPIAGLEGQKRCRQWPWELLCVVLSLFHCSIADSVRRIISRVSHPPPCLDSPLHDVLSWRWWGPHVPFSPTTTQHADRVLQKLQTTSGGLSRYRSLLDRKKAVSTPIVSPPLYQLKTKPHQPTSTQPNLSNSILP